MRAPKAGNTLPALGTSRYQPWVGREKGGNSQVAAAWLPQPLGAVVKVRKRSLCQRRGTRQGAGQRNNDFPTHPPTLSSWCPSSFIQRVGQPGGTVLGVRALGAQSRSERSREQREGQERMGLMETASPEGNYLNVLQVCLGTAGDPEPFPGL